MNLFLTEYNIFLIIILIILLYSIKNKSNFTSNSNSDNQNNQNQNNRNQDDNNRNNWNDNNRNQNNYNDNRNNQNDMNQNDMNNNNKIHYIFWTGGYDSTFMIINYIKNGQFVQPIYMTGCVDGLGLSGRQSVQKELETMNKISSYYSNYLNYGLFHELIIIDCNKIQIDDDIKKIHMLAYNAGYYSRPINQYAYAEQISRNFGIIGELGVVKDLESSTYKFITGQNPYRNLIFPIIDLTKNDMIIIAKSKNFDNMLRATWSCWYPKNNKPCGTCEMCKGRDCALSP
jgi:hypothetical protein